MKKLRSAAYVAMAIGAAMALLSTAYVAAAGGAEEETVSTIGMSYNGPPDSSSNAVHLFAENFKQLVEERTDGRIQITLYPDSQLGEEPERMEQVMDGPKFNVASYAGIGTVFPELFAANVPFMFDDFGPARLFFDESEYWQEAQREFRDRTGAVLLAAVEEGGFLAFTNSEREIRSPDDFRGLTMRAMDDSQVALYRAFGASGTPIPWTEVYLALQTGVADGQMNPPMYIIIGSLYEVQEYMTNARVQYSMQYFLTNGEWFDSLPADDQEVIRDAALEANNITREDVESRVIERTDFIRDSGVQVYDPTPEELDEFRELGQPAYLRWLEDRMDERWIDLALTSAESANEAFR